MNRRLTVLSCAIALLGFAQPLVAADRLYVGQKFSAVQPCVHRNQGVEIEITSVSDGGTKAQATFTVNCWGAQSFSTGNKYRNGSVEVRGSATKFRFFSSGLKYGVLEWVDGNVSTEGGRTLLRFPPGKLKLSSSEHMSAPLVFELR